jgi:hypothetical protein
LVFKWWFLNLEPLAVGAEGLTEEQGHGFASTWALIPAAALILFHIFGAQAHLGKEIY